jgi:solute carrier family 8 (sodium/calcium exchanger)
VTESAGVASVTVVKKILNQSITFGIRTVKDTAVPDHDYKDIDMRIKMSASEMERAIEIPIIDNNEWEPDLDFLVELYEIDAPGKERLKGDDTITRVTILDEDFPGTLGFQVTNIRVD